MSGFQRACPKRDCGRLCGPNALFCIDCGTALVTPQAVEEGLARIRAEKRDQRQRAQAKRAENGRRSGGSNRGTKARKCPWCGRTCYGPTCEAHREVAVADQGLDLL